jgi:hypothetical protein
MLITIHEMFYNPINPTFDLSNELNYNLFIMKKFKLMALALAIGTASVFATNVDVDDTQLDATYDAEMLQNEAYGDADFYMQLQKENETHSGDIIFRSKNLNSATITDDEQGLKIFDKYLKDNYKKSFEYDISVEDSTIKDEPCHLVGVMEVKGKLCYLQF